DSLIYEAQFIIAKSAYYAKDSLGFIQTIHPILESALAEQDTNILVRAYNLKGVFYFSMDDKDQGIQVLRIPDQRQYYSAHSLEENVFNLGALIDICLGYSNNLDSVYYYVSRLQQLANLYPSPSAQVVSRFKMAQLLAKATDYSAALNTLKTAYPYLDKIENRGYLHYYYKGLINNFIALEAVDSARHYIDILQKTASYPDGDLRNCYIIASELRANLSLGMVEEMPAAFEACYERAIDRLNQTQKAGVQTMNFLYVKALFSFQKKDWKTLDEVLSILIKYAEKGESKEFLVDALGLKYESLQARGRLEAALEVHLQYKARNDEANQYIFSHSEMILKNQMNLALAEKENRGLQIENQNQKLRMEKDRSMLFLFLISICFLVLVVTYFVHLSYVNARQSKNLEHLVKERTLQLKETNKVLPKTNHELLASNRELERFAFIASHDLKTPLHNMIQFAGLLNRKIQPQADEDINTYLSYIINGGKRMNSLIEDVLEFSKLNKTEADKKNTKVDLNKIVEDLQNSISNFLSERNGRIKINSLLPAIEGNYSQLFILFKNWRCVKCNA
ncbi:MAG: histidine kinase dimerization/phospho-acceptor domain-containing protein, partial [Bacteroidota bacterium]